MVHRYAAIIAALSLLMSVSATAQVPVTLRYGQAERQTARLYLPERARRAPLIVYIHGGGWSEGAQGTGTNGAQAAHWTSLGYAYATVGYRLLPDATPEAQLADVAQAIAKLVRQRGIDPHQIALIGHSSGGTMAATLGTDPIYLQQAHIRFDALRAVVLLDPSLLDVPAWLAMPAMPGVDKFFRRTFGDDARYQAKLSPVAQAGLPDAPHWLVVANQANSFSQGQADALIAALQRTRTSDAAIITVTGSDHLKLNRNIGQPDDAATASIDAFLARIFR